MKQCHYCKKLVQDEAIYCRYCHHDIRSMLYQTNEHNSIEKKENIITLLIVDDVPEFRDNIKEALSKEKDILVVGEARTGIEAIAQFKQLNPDVISMNLCMPDLDGIEASKVIRDLDNNAQIFILSVLTDPENMNKAMQVGIKDYLFEFPDWEEYKAVVRKLGKLAKEGKLKINKCPFCAEIIQDGSTICNYCGRKIIPTQVNNSNKTLKKDVIVLSSRSSTIIFIGIILIVVLCILINNNSIQLFAKNGSYRYSGKCIAATEALNNLSIDNCVWGIPTSTDLSSSGVWIHFKEEPNAPPYTFFAVLIKGDETIWGFYTSPNNFRDRFVGHCIEVYGTISYYKSSYSNNQPVMEVYKPNDIRLCP